MSPVATLAGFLTIARIGIAALFLATSLCSRAPSFDHWSQTPGSESCLSAVAPARLEASKSTAADEMLAVTRKDR
jgi:hypothetical protein